MINSFKSVPIKMIFAECVLHYQLTVCCAAVKSKPGKMIIAEFVPLYQLIVCSAAVNNIPC